jgi:hypothetical protein
MAQPRPQASARCSVTRQRPPREAIYALLVDVSPVGAGPTIFGPSSPNGRCPEPFRSPAAGASATSPPSSASANGGGDVTTTPEVRRGGGHRSLPALNDLTVRRPLEPDPGAGRGWSGSVYGFDGARIDWLNVRFTRPRPYRRTRRRCTTKEPLVLGDQENRRPGLRCTGSAILGDGRDDRDAAWQTGDLAFGGELRGRFHAQGPQAEPQELARGSSSFRSGE